MAHYSVEAFVTARIEQEPTNWISYEELMEIYLEFCNEQGLPAVADHSALGRHLRDELPFDVETSRRVPEGGEKQLRGVVGLEVVDVAQPPDGTIVVETSWACESEHDGWVVLEDLSAYALVDDDTRRVHVAFDAALDTFDLQEALDAFHAAGGDIHPIPTHLRESDELDPRDYELVRRS